MIVFSVGTHLVASVVSEINNLKKNQLPNYNVIYIKIMNNLRTVLNWQKTTENKFIIYEISVISITVHYLLSPIEERCSSATNTSLQQILRK